MHLLFCILAKCNHNDIGLLWCICGLLCLGVISYMDAIIGVQGHVIDGMSPFVLFIET